MDLDALTDTIDHLVDTDPRIYADGESVVALQRQLARLDAFATTATASFDASGLWSLDGARSAAAWIATRCHLPVSHARRLIRRGRSLAQMPASTKAWLAGDIGAAQVDVLASLRTPVTQEAFARDEAMLATEASKLSFASFSRAAAYWSQLADPDGVEESAEDRRTRRGLYLERSLDGMWLGGMTLDPISGTIVANELQRIERALFEADWADAKDRVGGDPTVSDLARSTGQRRADALVEMATRSQTAPADGKRPAPLFSVFVGYETFHGRIAELANGTVVTPGSLLPWLSDAVIERAVFGTEARVEVSAKARLFTGATRRAIELRDRGCTHPYCDGTARDCQVDHIVPYTEGGPTTQANGRILCGFHNRLRNQQNDQNERPPPDG